MAELRLPQMNFTALGQLPAVYQKAQADELRKQTLASLGQGTEVDANALLKSGDLSLAQLGVQMQNRQTEEAWRREQAARSQSNADRSHSLQERQLTEGKLPAGFERNPSGGLRPLAGGPADPAYKRTVTDRQNAPAGYKWADPNNADAGLIAIPGGPGEKVPAEVAARLGLAKSFLNQLPAIKERVKAGEATGLWDGAMGAANVGGAGEIRRQISSGAEALLRNLTGAGMNIDEAKKYVGRYEPQWNDKAETVISKLEQLERELRSVNDVVSQGRGGSVLDRPSVGTKQPVASGPISKAQYDALPSGTPFTAPDGSQRIKP